MSVNRKMAVFLWILVSVFYAYQYIFRVLPNLIIPEMIDIFGIGAENIGDLGVYYLGYGLAHIPLGILADRFSAKKVIPVCILLCSLGNLPLIMSDSWNITIWGRIIVGIGSSAAPIALFKVISQCFNERLFERLLGASVACGLIGAVFGGEPLQAAFDSYTWQVVLQYTIYFGIALSIVTFILMPKEDNEVEENEKSSIWSDVKMVLTSKQVLMLSILGGFMLGPLEGFADVWGKEFFIQVYNYDSDIAARLPSLIFLGMIVGCLFIGHVSSKTKAYFGIPIFAGVVMGGVFTAVLMLKCSCALMYLLFSVVGVLSAYQIVIIYKATTYMPKRLTGMTSAVTNSIIMAFGFISHKIIGLRMSKFSIVLNDAVHYPEEAFIKALAIIPIGLFLGAFGLMILKMKDSA